MTDVRNLIASRVDPNKVLAPKPPPPVKRFDWDSHVVVECTWAELTDEDADLVDFHFDWEDLVGIDIGKKFPKPISIDIEEEHDRWLADENAYYERYGIDWHEDEPFEPCWTMKYVTYLTVDGKKFIPTDDYSAKWVIKIPSYLLGKTGRLVEEERLRAEKRAKNEARKQAKRDRDRQIRERMKSPKKGK